MLNEGSYAVAPRADVYRNHWIVNGDEAIWFDVLKDHLESPFAWVTNPGTRGSALRVGHGGRRPWATVAPPRRLVKTWRPRRRRRRRGERVGIVRLALPAALALWFIWKARDNALFLLGIPVLMVMGGSVFFENAKVFWKPGRFDAVTLLMIWLTIVWVLTLVRRSRLNDEPAGPVRGQSAFCPRNCR